MRIHMQANSIGSGWSRWCLNYGLGLPRLTNRVFIGTELRNRQIAPVMRNACASIWLIPLLLLLRNFHRSEAARAWPEIVRKEIDSALNPEALAQELRVSFPKSRLALYFGSNLFVPKSIYSLYVCFYLYQYTHDRFYLISDIHPIQKFHHHLCIHTYTYMHTHIHTHTHTYIHAHTHTGRASQPIPPIHFLPHRRWASNIHTQLPFNLLWGLPHMYGSTIFFQF